MSRPTDQELRGWMADPMHYTGGKLRYVVLVPGQTIFIPSGVIYFAFRLVGQNLQTLALGGHVLLWSALDVWMEVVLCQLMRYSHLLMTLSSRLATEEYVRECGTGMNRALYLLLDGRRCTRLEGERVERLALSRDRWRKDDEA